MQSNDSTVLDELALARVSGGLPGTAMAKGVAAGALAIAPFVVPKWLGAKDDDVVTPMATAGVSWGVLGGWAVHGIRAIRRMP